MTRTVGYIGLGNIGGAMAVRLATHDHELIVHDLRKAAMERLSNYGAKAGLDPDIMLDVINASSGRNTATTDKFPKAILTRTFDYGFNAQLMHKDLKLLMQHAENLNVPMFLGRMVTSMWAFAMSQGEGPNDYTNLMKYIEGWAGIEVRGKAAPEEKP